MPDAHSTSIFRRYTELKRRRKIATIVASTAWLGIAQFLPIPAFFCKGGNPFKSEVMKGHYYFFPKGSGRQEATKGQFLLGWCSGILFLASLPVLFVAGVTWDRTVAEIKKIEPKLG